MTEIFASNSNQPSVSSNLTDCLVIASETMPWEDSGVDGFAIKVLMEDARQARRVWLMKVDAGAWSPPHSHTEYEQIYVLSGSFYDDENEYKTGDFITRKPGAMHSAGSHDGAEVLLIYYPEAPQ